MNRYFIFIFLVIGSFAQAQGISGTQLLDSAISYHDPNGNWKAFKGKLWIEMETPSSSLRETVLELDLPAHYFKSTVTKDALTVTSELDKGKCTLRLNGSKTIAPKLKDSLKITCDRAKMMKNYYTYLYGLPMKLKDPGTILDPNVARKKFKGKEYLVLKAGYDKEVRSDTWYFYFDPKTYALEAYRFYHDERKNDGEYILLSEAIRVNGIAIPKKRAWYYNKDDKYLGTDILRKASDTF